MNKKNNDKNYSIVNEEITKELKKINLQLHLSMNGITSDKMNAINKNYLLNQGVSWTRIKEIASQFTPNSTIAQLLWNTNKREQQLIATLLIPIESCNEETMNKWMQNNNTYETSDALAKLIAKSQISNQSILSWLKRNDFNKHIAIQAINNRLNNIDNLTLDTFLEQLFNNTLQLSQPTANAIINTTLKLLTLHPSKRMIIQTYMEKMTKSEDTTTQYIANICLDETKFMEQQSKL